MAHWFDGDALWMAARAESAEVTALRDHPECVVVLAPAEGAPGMAADGHARVFTAASPVRFALHGPAIATALSALAVRNVGTLVTLASQAAAAPARWAPQHHVVLRIALADVRSADVPPTPAAVGPPLPTALPADVRRRLSGTRIVMVVWDEPPLRVVPASWGPDLQLFFEHHRPRPAPGQRVAALLDADADKPAEGVGAALHGHVSADGTLQPDRATWWRGLDAHTADVAPPSSAGIVMPD